MITEQAIAPLGSRLSVQTRGEILTGGRRGMRPQRQAAAAIRASGRGTGPARHAFKRKSPANTPSWLPPPPLLAFKFCDAISPRPAERCQSGRSGRSRKPLYLHGYREFESHPLRQVLRITHCAFGRLECAAACPLTLSATSSGDKPNDGFIVPRCPGWLGSSGSNSPMTDIA